ncbi:MAG: hypothetical protein KA956_14955 [Pyrinomonadaceae bacterium]|nr:hypothetical protein [Acidobacteriota bacterium]MBK7934870.1 hypothetical protein [Acidobacteriota bacterium]MBP7377767.1 hypothetical protein [Pyrinomonadaceae bacterium]
MNLIREIVTIMVSDAISACIWREFATLQARVIKRLTGTLPPGIVDWETRLLRSVPTRALWNVFAFPRGSRHGATCCHPLHGLRTFL